MWRQGVLAVRSQREDRVADGCLQYILESRPLHDRLRQGLTQLAGLSLLVMLRQAASPDMDGRIRIAEALSETRQMLLALRVPGRAAHHHHHLLEATRTIERVCALIASLKVRTDEAARRELAAAVRIAADHLRLASRAMPGFEMVDLNQACCAAHANALRLEPADLKF